VRDPDSFAALILTNGRPDNVVTYRALREAGYTGRIYLVIDDQDATGDAYRERYGAEWVVEFDKEAIAARVDTADGSTDRRAILFARVAAFDIARDLGLDYHVQLDDDYPLFHYRSANPGPLGGTHDAKRVRSMDDVFRAMIRLLEDTGALTVAFSQGGDQMNLKTVWKQGYTRKAMNSFVVRTDRPIPFVGRMCEDVCAYTLFGSRGELFLSVPHVRLIHNPTMKQRGGMTEAYIGMGLDDGPAPDVGAYVKSFTPIMMSPSFVQIQKMGSTHARLHHRVEWNNAVPKILDPRLQKTR
jgi:hypothetical protein